MTQKGIQINSPLEELSDTYLYGRDKIKDIPDLHRLILVPAGFSHRDRQTNQVRQVTHEALYSIACGLKTETLFKPLEQYPHNIILTPETDNQHDDYAVRIDIEVSIHSQTIRSLFKVLEGKDKYLFNLGYIPKAISRYVNKNINMFTGGYVASVHPEIHKKFYLAKVALSYAPVYHKTAAQRQLSRFTNVLE